jgi:DNA-directed RNA polymerase subunit RPC12/RpoP
MADVFAGNVMDLCCYCGKEFEKKAKGYQRSSLSSNIRVRQFEKSLKEVIEEEFGVTLTPEQKTKHFLCSTCSSSLMTLARSKKSGNEALSKLKSTATGTSYLSKKINVRSPFPTPRKVKRPRIRSPVKVRHYIYY